MIMRLGTAATALSLASVVLLGASPVAHAQTPAPTAAPSPTPSTTPSPAPTASPSGRTSPTPSPQASVCDRTFFVTAEVNVAVITAGNAPMLSGQAAGPLDPDPCTSRNVSRVGVYARSWGVRDYAYLGSAQVGEDLRWSMLIRPSVQTSYIARISLTDDPTSNSATTESAPVLVRVHRRITLSQTSTSIAGQLSPADGTVPVGLLQDTGAGWRHYRSDVADASGAFTFPALPPGRYAVFTSARAGVLRGSALATLPS